ncbi:MAG: hypothetical protein ACRC15_02285 [Cetobacterium sp.]
MKFKIKKCKVINPRPRPVNNEDIKNERIAIDILEKGINKKVLEQLEKYHMWQERFSSFDFEYCIGSDRAVIVDVKTVSNNFFVVGVDKLKRWQDIKAVLKLVVYLDVETKSRITVVDITNIDLSKRRVYTSRFGTNYIDLRKEYPLSLGEVNIYFEGALDKILETR